MDYDYYDDHDEDELPVLSLPTTFLTKKTAINNDKQDNIGNDRSTDSLANWKTLYETSLHSLQSDDEDRRLLPKTPFYVDRQPSIAKPKIAKSYAPIYQPQVALNTSKSKWEIRLPQLLDGTVGPDRQKRDMLRRHTTNIVFQGPNSNTNDFHSYFSSQLSNATANDRPTNPLVKQLKQKFDQMTVDSARIISLGNRTQFSSDNLSKLRRVTSLNYRGKTAVTGERLIQQPRAVLPIRPTPEITTLKTKSASTESLNTHKAINNGRTYRRKINPPISYPKYTYPPVSTTSVVKQLIGGGATLIYDSIAEPSSSKIKSSVTKHKNNIQEIRETLTSNNSFLSGRQLRSDSIDSAYATLQKEKTNNKKLIEPKKDETNENYYEAVSSQTSNDLSGSNDVQASNEPFDHDIDTNEDEREIYPVFDID
ncbi:unnamed protein product [Rotaria sp. Silwood2]|nr:unnamed protein product [Rotaria sp. Silwood2]